MGLRSPRRSETSPRSPGGRHLRGRQKKLMKIVETLDRAAWAHQREPAPLQRILTAGGGAFGHKDGPKRGATSCRQGEETWELWKAGVLRQREPGRCRRRVQGRARAGTRRLGGPATTWATPKYPHHWRRRLRPQGRPEAGRRLLPSVRSTFIFTLRETYILEWLCRRRCAGVFTAAGFTVTPLSATLGETVILRLAASILADTTQACRLAAARFTLRHRCERHPWRGSGAGAGLRSGKCWSWPR